ncbi:hypothetical protein JCM10213_002755 [Rhodosporidiobolus nylandii]
MADPSMAASYAASAATSSAPSLPAAGPAFGALPALPPSLPTTVAPSASAAPASSPAPKKKAAPKKKPAEEAPDGEPKPKKKRSAPKKKADGGAEEGKGKGWRKGVKGNIVGGLDGASLPPGTPGATAAGPSGSGTPIAAAILAPPKLGNHFLPGKALEIGTPRPRKWRRGAGTVVIMGVSGRPLSLPGWSGDDFSAYAIATGSGPSQEIDELASPPVGTSPLPSTSKSRTSLSAAAMTPSSSAQSLPPSSAYPTPLPGQPHVYVPPPQPPVFPPASLPPVSVSGAGGIPILHHPSQPVYAAPPTFPHTLPSMQMPPMQVPGVPQFSYPHAYGTSVAPASGADQLKPPTLPPIPGAGVPPQPPV